MTNKMIQGEIRFGAFLLLLGVCVMVLLGLGCSTASVDKSTAAGTKNATINQTAQNQQDGQIEEMPKGPTIEIKSDSPSNTVKVFYERLRKNHFRDALLLTNLKPAVDGLGEKELADLGVDFKKIAGSVPEQMPINGEIITGKTATVTVNMPNEKDGRLEIQELQLRSENGIWVLLVADREGETRVRKEGKNYFFALRMDVHHAEAQAMLTRISKAQTVYSLKNDGKFADLKTLIQKGYVPEDALTAVSTGYTYDVALAFDRTTYTALATPENYGKSGKLSFALKIRRGAEPQLVAKDIRGKSLNS